MGNLSSLFLAQYEEEEDDLVVNIDELNEVETLSADKHSVDKIEQFKIDQTKVVYGYVRQEYKLKHSFSFVNELVKLIVIFYGTNCCEFYGIGLLDKYKEMSMNTKKCHLLSKFSNLCMRSNQFVTINDEIMIYTSKNDLICFKNDVLYYHSLSNVICGDLIINKQPSYYKSYIYSVDTNLLHGIGQDRYASFWNGIHSGEFAIFTGLSKFFQNINAQICEICCGLGHTLILTECGNIYSFGRNGDYQCGYESNSKPIEILSKINKLSKYKIVSIATGSLHSICLDIENNLWCFGDNSWAQLGIESHSSSTLPLKNPFYKHISIKKIQCGNRTSIIIDDKYCCYMCGENTNDAYGGYGQCGSVIHQNLYTPNLINGLQIKYVSNSYNHTLMLTHVNNNVFSMGNNKYLQCAPSLKDVKNICQPYHLTKHEMGIGQHAVIQTVIAVNNSSIIVTK